MPGLSFMQPNNFRHARASAERQPASDYPRSSVGYKMGRLWPSILVPTRGVGGGGRGSITPAILGAGTPLDPQIKGHGFKPKGWQTRSIQLLLGTESKTFRMMVEHCSTF